MGRSSERRGSRRRRAGVLALMGSMLGAQAMGQSGGDALEQGFKTPPKSAEPRVWWHWMNGNITKEGIDLDLDWMKRVGLGGFQNFDAALNTPQVIDKRLVYMTPEWKDAFKHATEKANSLDLEEAVAGSPGWSETGGPWVKPNQAMKKLVWSETTVEGGKPFQGALPKPPSVTGPFQTLAQQDPMGQMGGVGKVAPRVEDFYADSAVVAYREPEDVHSMAELHPTVTTSSGSITAETLWSGDLMNSVRVKIAPVGQKAWIQYEFPKPQPIQAVTFTFGGDRDPLAIFAGESGNGPVLESSDDGQNFTPIVTMPTSGAPQHTMSFPIKTAKYFRLSFLTKTPPKSSQDIDLSELGVKAPEVPTEYHIAEFALHTEGWVNRFEEKAAFATLPDLYSSATKPVSATSAIAESSVIDLTSKMSAAGSLAWTPPQGRWTILRMGYSLTGITNHPAPPEATGPEVDKLNKNYVREYIDHYLDSYKDATGGLMGKQGVQYVITDSWEAGTQNWTDDMIAEFTKRRGYDPHSWMPVLTGRVVGSAEQSDRFLWDFRKTIADLVAENHYGTIAAALHERGMGQYGESHEEGRATIGDGMEMKRADDVPMAAMWTQLPGVNTEQYGYNADIRESASVAHIYGQNLVAAESLTAAQGPWAWSPATLKPTADKELAMGLNRFVIHESAHQPLVGKAPGLTLGPFGQWFNRNEIWAEQAGPWITYLARNSYLMQQGRFVADIAYFYGEDSNLTAIFGSKSPAVPEGFNFDYVNADVLEHKLSVANGRLTTASGMKYRILELDPYSRHMSLPVLRKIAELVQGGAVVVGERPMDDPSLADKTPEFQKLVNELWGKEGTGPHKHGKGQLWSGMDASAALKALQVTPDFAFSKPEADSNVIFVHRDLDGTEIYYVDNRSDRPEKITASFRVAGKEPELWHADTGKIERASYQTTQGTTSVPLTLDPFGTVLVVFRKAATAPSRTIPEPQEAVLGTVDGPWQVSFEPNQGAPEKVNFSSLSSWSENSDAGVRYFSGHGTYTKTIMAPSDWSKGGASVWLDLGDVKNVAEVSLNGKPLGIAWKAPYRIDLSPALHEGSNTLEVRVANLWVNRLIGDQQPDAANKYTFTTHNPYKANSKLLPSGLLGPVRMIQVSKAE